MRGRHEFLEHCVQIEKKIIACHKRKKDAKAFARKINEETAWLNAKYGTDFPEARVQGGRRK